MRCQVKTLEDAGRPLSPLEKAGLRTKKAGRKWTGRLARWLRHPVRAWRARHGEGRRDASVSIPDRVLNLRPGERVRIRPFEEIRATLDAEGRSDGLGFMVAAMKKYCGGTYTVRKRVRLFFDERKREMRRARDVVILEGVFCETPPDEADDWAGCDRACFLFWKEAWLERWPEEAPKSP